MKCFYPLQSCRCDHDEEDGVGDNAVIDNGDHDDVGDNVAVDHDYHVCDGDNITSKREV